MLTETKQETIPNSDAFLAQQEALKRDLENNFVDEDEMINYFKARREGLNELVDLVDALVKLRVPGTFYSGKKDGQVNYIEPIISGRIVAAIHESLDNLYSQDPGQLEVTQGYKDSLPQVKASNLGEAPNEPIIEAFGGPLQTSNSKEDISTQIDAACQDKPLMSWNSVCTPIICSRLARLTWDNTLNQEYIIVSTGIKGELLFTKYYRSEDGDYYKKVEHTYKPTKEDIEANDWYII